MTKKTKTPPPISPVPPFLEDSQNLSPEVVRQILNNILAAYHKGIELGIALTVDHVKFYEKEKCVDGCTIDVQIHPVLDEFKKERVQKIIQPLLLELLEEPDSELKKKLILKLKGILLNAGVTTSAPSASVTPAAPAGT